MCPDLPLGIASRTDRPPGGTTRRSSSSPSTTTRSATSSSSSRPRSQSTDRAAERIAIYDGPTPQAEREEIKRAFNTDPKKHPVRILIATDAAREGLNLQAHCWNLFHFDVPWNPSRWSSGTAGSTASSSPRTRSSATTSSTSSAPRIASSGARAEDRDDQARTRQPLPVVESRLADTLKFGIRRRDIDAIEKETRSGGPRRQESSRPCEEELGGGHASGRGQTLPRPRSTACGTSSRSPRSRSPWTRTTSARRSPAPCNSWVPNRSSRSPATEDWRSAGRPLRVPGARPARRGRPDLGRHDGHAPRPRAARPEALGMAARVAHPPRRVRGHAARWTRTSSTCTSSTASSSGCSAASPPRASSTTTSRGPACPDEGRDPPRRAHRTAVPLRTACRPAPRGTDPGHRSLVGAVAAQAAARPYGREAN